MHRGQRVRLKPASGLVHDREISPRAAGVVTCCYRLLRDKEDAPERVDVVLDEKVTVWGASAVDFEPVAEQT